MAGPPPIRQATGGAAGKLHYASGELIDVNIWLVTTCGISQNTPIFGDSVTTSRCFLPDIVRPAVLGSPTKLVDLRPYLFKITKKS
ncbi:MAG: hypothetical protein ACI8TF_001398 [Paracoccaceae bacterium]|jgi:hypothetical protein